MSKIPAIQMEKSDLVICSDEIRDIIDLEQIHDKSDSKLFVEILLNNNACIICDFIELQYSPKILTIKADIQYLQTLLKNEILKTTLKYGIDIIDHFDSNQNHVISLSSLKNIDNKHLKIVLTMTGSGILK